MLLFSFNCLLCLTLPLSGIDNSIKLFEPEAETPADLADLEAIMERNRDRRNPMHAVPLQIRALLRALQQGQDGPIAIRVRTTNDVCGLMEYRSVML